MIFDRIAIDFLDWVRSLLWSGPTSEGKPHSPTPRIIWYKSGSNGLIQRVERDTPRAISTWIFTPSKRDIPSSEQIKFYLCLDMLGKGDCYWKYSHRMSIWQASVWIQIQGDVGQEGFDAIQIYTALYDLSGPGKRADWWGNRVMKDFAENVLERGVDYFEAAESWELEFRLSISKVLGKYPPKQFYS